MPTRSTASVSRETQLCLQHHLDDYPSKVLTMVGKPVVEARNQLAKEACEVEFASLDLEPRYVLWVDDDAWWPAGAVDRAVTILEENPDVAMVSGVFSIRSSFMPPGVGKAFRYGEVTIWEAFSPLRHKVGELVDADLVGGHWFMIRRDVLAALGDEPFNLLPNHVVFRQRVLTMPGFATEDHSFCHRLRSAGHRIVTDRGLRVGHVDAKTGLCFFALLPPRIANGLEESKYDPELAKLRKPLDGEYRPFRDYFGGRKDVGLEGLGEWLQALPPHPAVI